MDSPCLRSTRRATCHLPRYDHDHISTTLAFKWVPTEVIKNRKAVVTHSFFPLLQKQWALTVQGVAADQSWVNIWSQQWIAYDIDVLMLAQQLLGALLKKHMGCLFSLESISIAACGLDARLGVRPTERCLLNTWQCGAASPNRNPTAVCLHLYSWLFFELSGASFQEVITKH